ncbi:TAXI family TRAP transporter solute-binding subunit [Carboxylicivirga sp. M1479]|uniref:TAXI family TRAP transporter solute-binding subunit n=1 Tax=Carboxylicivirga sp. M1479 TaxID=2594476 RepID=UPI001177B3A7|nr:TAXI family TRAP transporter solute-binding subunit [Carboxylicivirga sp. M1479]TRX70336.1 hypothetical protein FNN09_12715 [Carboxylicivirga sp. M1479]
MNRKLTIMLALLLVVSISNILGQINILSGPINGSYNRFADDIVKVMAEKEGIEVVNMPTQGSAANFKFLIDPETKAQVAFIQSDYFSLLKAKDLVENTHKTGSIKVIMPLAKEQIHLFTRKSNNITRLQDLDNQRLGVGTDDQSSSFTAEIIRKRSKVNWYPNKLNYDKMLKKIYSGNLEAGLIVGSAPLAMLDIDPQIMVDELVLIDLNDFNGWAENYENDVIKADEYPWLDKDIETFSLRTLLIVNMDKISGDEEKTIEAIKAGIAKNIEYLKADGHPRWSTVKVTQEATPAQLPAAAPSTQQ